MKQHSLWFFAGILFLASCASDPPGTTITGTITNGANLQAYFDQMGIGTANNIIGKTDLDASGNFTLNFPEGLKPGPYRVRIGAQKVNLVLNGEEKKINIKADLSQLDQFGADITGSGLSVALNNLFKGISRQEINQDGLSNFIDTTSNSMLAMYAAYATLQNNPQFLELYEKAETRVIRDYPQNDFAKEFSNLVGNIKAEYTAFMATQLIKPGQPAPDIRLPNPNGKEMALSELKGKVVLLDFWASWCGPCRRENPNVVKAYEKYNKQGFEIFSVSLDRPNGKQAWIDAIKKDNLKWPTHVSDLQFWDAAPAKLYGVSSIPKAFLIDREGNIAIVGNGMELRGPNLEKAIETYLNYKM